MSCAEPLHLARPRAPPAKARDFSLACSRAGFDASRKLHTSGMSYLLSLTVALFAVSVFWRYLSHAGCQAVARSVSIGPGNRRASSRCSRRVGRVDERNRSASRTISRCGVYIKRTGLSSGASCHACTQKLSVLQDKGPPHPYAKVGRYSLLSRQDTRCFGSFHRRFIAAAHSASASRYLHDGEKVAVRCSTRASAMSPHRHGHRSLATRYKWFVPVDSIGTPTTRWSTMRRRETATSPKPRHEANGGQLRGKGTCSVGRRRVHHAHILTIPSWRRQDHRLRRVWRAGHHRNAVATGLTRFTTLFVVVFFTPTAPGNLGSSEDGDAPRVSTSVHQRGKGRAHRG